MTTREYMEQNRVAARDICVVLHGRFKNLSRRGGNAWKAVTQFTTETTRPISRVWRSILLARAFYPTLSLPEGSGSALASSEGSDSASAHDDLFDPMLVRSVSRPIHALIRFRVAIRIGASGEARLNALLCRQNGWSEDQVGAASIGYDAAAFSESERLVLRYTDDLTRTPMDLDLATLRQLRIHFSDDQLTELTAAITKENCKARFRTAFDVTQSKHTA